MENQNFMTTQIVTVKETRMVTRKRIITTVLVVSFLLLTATVGAAAMDEIPNEKTLWNKAEKIADASESQIPGIRRISYKETDGKGNVVYADQAVVLMEGSHNNRYLTVRDFGNDKVLSLMARYTDGMVLTPFNDNLYDVDYSYTGVDETIQGKTTAVYSFSMAYDAALPFYDPNYRASGTILGWDFEEDDFDGTIAGSLWLDKISGAPRKMETSYVLEDNTQAGTLKLTQTVYFTYENSFILPTQISTQGSLQVLAGRRGQIALTDFQIFEEQDTFWDNQKFTRGEIVH